jgi:hypothetical protein
MNLDGIVKIRVNSEFGMKIKFVIIIRIESDGILVAKDRGMRLLTVACD